MKLAAVVLVVSAGGVSAEDVRLELRVTSVAGDAVYVDRGSASGLAEGDRVEFRLDAGVLATGVVRSASAQSARVELDTGSERPAVGVRGVVRVPDTRPGARDAAEEPATVAHPPWTHPPETWSADRPLLAPAFGIPPEARAPDLHGRAWLRFDGTRDVEGGRTYGLAAIGADATLENPFGDGGALRADVELYTRTSDVAADDGLHDYDETRVRIDRLAYVVGGTEERQNRFLLGRFLQSGVPELGLLDGAEWSHGTDRDTRFGASVGWMPEPYADLASFEDLQAAVHVRHAFDRDGRASAGLAWQSTWHEGEHDRDLAVAVAELRPADRLSLRASAWVDFYGADDEIKGSGAELTEARISGSWTIAPGSGVGAYAFERRIPELLRDEFLARRADDVRDSVLDRVGVNGWTTIGARTRLDARLERWSDQDDDGVSGEVGATYSGLFGAESSVSGALSWIEGSYSSGPGARLQARDTFGAARVSLGWQSYWYAQKDYGGDDDEIAQHALFGSVDVPLSDRWDLSFLADRSIGDDVDSWTAGFRLQTGF